MRRAGAGRVAYLAEKAAHPAPTWHLFIHLYNQMDALPLPTLTLTAQTEPPPST